MNILTKDDIVRRLEVVESEVLILRAMIKDEPNKQDDQQEMTHE